MSLVALVDYGHPQGDRFRRRWNLALSLALLELVRILNRADELQSIITAKAVLIGKKPAASRTLFHGIILQRVARLY
jgi:hypothetical protein